MVEIPYRLPLVIGATGHRDLRDEDIPALRRAVAVAIKRLKRDYLDCPCILCRLCRLWGVGRLLRRWDLCCDHETPIIVLSSLAEGADRLIAEVAMEHGAKLIAPLPMPLDEYRHDFNPGLKPDAAVGFDRLREEAIATPVMRFVGDNRPDNVKEEARRALQYREVGIFIVRHCHVLIGLWKHDESNTATGG